MKHLLFFAFLFCLIAGCKNKKYDPQTYEVKTSVDNMSDEEATLVRLHNECLTFMNYCDQNYSSDMKLFVRDYLRTYKEWKTEGIKDYSNVVSCHLEKKKKGRFEINVRSIYFDIWHRDDEQPYFKAVYNFFSDDAYKNLRDMACEEFGEPDEEKEMEYGTICRWYVNDVKTISVEPDHWCASFSIKYILE